MAPRTRFERVTLGLEVLCSIQLSYRGMRVLYQIYGAGNVAEATVRLCRKRQGTSEPRFGFALQNDRDSTLRMYQSKNLTRGQVFTLVRVRGIEPRSQVWKTCILTAVLHPRTTVL